MKTGNILLAVVVLAIIGVFSADRWYVSTFQEEFKELEKERIITSNKLATAKIVHENLNHVRDLVFKNMDFPGQQDSVSAETRFYEYLTSCLNDLKLKLVAARPARPRTEGRVTTLGYDLEVEGDFFSFGELCAKFENSRRIISLETYDVSLLDDRRRYSSNNKRIGVKMRVETYRVKKAPQQL